MARGLAVGDHNSARQVVCSTADSTFCHAMYSHTIPHASQTGVGHKSSEHGADGGARPSVVGRAVADPVGGTRPDSASG